MVVAVQRPERKRDPLEIIAQGLNVASGILGIKESFERSDLREAQLAAAKATELNQQDKLKAQIAERERIQSGQLNAPEFAAMREKFTPVAEGTKGAIGGFTYQGQPQFFRPTSEITTESQLAAANTAREKQLAKDRQKREDDLRGEFDARIEKPNGPITQLRKVRQIVDIYNKKEDLSKADDVAAINLYSRLLSPGIVTTTDFENVQRVGGYPEQAKAYIEQIRGTGQLTNLQRSEILAAVESMSQGPLNEFNTFADTYSRLAKEGTLPVDVGDVVAPEKVDFVNSIGDKFNEAYQRLGRTALTKDYDLDTVIDDIINSRQTPPVAGK